MKTVAKFSNWWKQNYLLGSVAILTIFLISFSVWTNSVAQSSGGLTEKEKKDLKNQLTALARPITNFKAFKDGIDASEERLNAAENESGRISAELTRKNGELSDKRLEINELKKELEDLRNKPSGDRRNIYFRIQIAAFQKSDPLAVYFENFPDFIKVDASQDYRKYTVGRYDQYGEAKKLERYLLDQGAQVFVVAYEDGRRVDNITSLPDEYVPRELSWEP